MYRYFLIFILLNFLSCQKENVSTENKQAFDDISKAGGNFYLQGNKWNKFDLTYCFGSGFSIVGSEEIKRAFRNAFFTWGRVLSNITFKEITDVSQADIVVVWGSQNHTPCPHSFPNGVLAHAYYPPPNSDAFAGDIHLNSDLKWTINSNSNTEFDVETVALHEIGHSLGLGHSLDINAVMTPNYSGVRRSLTSNDEEALCNLYCYPNGINDNPATNNASIIAQYMNGNENYKNDISAIIKKSDGSIFYYLGNNTVNKPSSILGTINLSGIEQSSKPLTFAAFDFVEVNNMIAVCGSVDNDNNYNDYFGYEYSKIELYTNSLSLIYSLDITELGYKVNIRSITKLIKLL